MFMCANKCRVLSIPLCHSPAAVFADFPLSARLAATKAVEN